METKKVEITLGGRPFSLETGSIARQATTAVLGRYGESVVLATLVVGDPLPPATSPKNFRDFQPMMVEYRERMYAAGKIPGGFFKREGRPTSDETLTARLIDRPLRALFPETFRNDVQIYVTVLSASEDAPPDILGMNAAGACAAIGDFPFAGPVASLRIGFAGGRFLLNPTRKQLEQSELNMVVSVNPEGICMVEADAREIPEEKLIEAFEFAVREAQPLLDAQRKLREAVGVQEKPYPLATFPPELLERLDREYGEELRGAFFLKGKTERKEALNRIREKILNALSLDEKGQQREDGIPFEDVIRAEAKLEEKIFRENALAGRRIDGRGPADIRPISIQVGVLPRVHGSAIFTRGETQALVTLTLGGKEDEQFIDSITEYKKRFNLHYNFPPFSVGEIKPIRGPGRREIGHGALAERSVECVLPDVETFPYTIRIVSDILESNGSSSMASVCGATLALMDGGVPIRAAVAGIAMGLIYEDEERFAVLSDILGTEDAYGDMDFKVAGTEKGVTGLQMDLKTPGITVEVIRRALAQAREGRRYILGRMREVISAPRSDLSPYAPRIVRVKVDPDKIGKIIGGGGRTIREIQKRTKTEIEFDDEEGVAVISGQTLEDVGKCATVIRDIVEGLKPGDLRKGKVAEIRDFGAFVEVELTGEQGLVHISEIADGYVERVEDYLKVGQPVDVQVIGVDETGKVRLSIKRANEALGKPKPEPVYQGSAPPRGGRRPGPPRGGRGGPRRGARGGGPPRGGGWGPRRNTDRGFGGPRR